MTAPPVDLDADLDGVDDALVEAREASQKIPSFRLELGHDRVVFVQPVLALIEAPWLEDLGIRKAR